MNRQTKIILIGLAVLGLLYSGTVGLGFRSGNDETPEDNSETSMKKYMEDNPPPAWTNIMDKILPEGKPYIALKDISVEGRQLINGKATINSNSASVTFKGTSGNYMRKVKIKIQSDSAIMLTYKDKAPSTTVESVSSKSKWKKDISSNGGKLTLNIDDASTNPYTIEFSGSK